MSRSHPLQQFVGGFRNCSDDDRGNYSSSYGSTFVLIVVLFILLIIVGVSYL